LTFIYYEPTRRNGSPHSTTFRPGRRAASVASSSIS